MRGLEKASREFILGSNNGNLCEKFQSSERSQHAYRRIVAKAIEVKSLHFMQKVQEAITGYWEGNDVVDVLFRKYTVTVI